METSAWKKNLEPHFKLLIISVIIDGVIVDFLLTIPGYEELIIRFSYPTFQFSLRGVGSTSRRPPFHHSSDYLAAITTPLG